MNDGHSNIPFEYPTSRQIGALRKLRYHHGSARFCILYRRSDNFLILLHTHQQISGKIPVREQQIARDRRADFKS